MSIGTVSTWLSLPPPVPQQGAPSTSLQLKVPLLNPEKTPHSLPILSPPSSQSVPVDVQLPGESVVPSGYPLKSSDQMTTCADRLFRKKMERMIVKKPGLSPFIEKEVNNDFIVV